jgi:hypothetical protein
MPGGVKILGVVPAVSRMGSTTIIHLYGGGPADAAKLTDPERLYLGLHFLAAHQQGYEAALEIEGTGSKRTMYLLHRAGTRAIANNVQVGLEVKDLATEDDPAASKAEFYREVKRTLRTARGRIQEGRIDAVRGEQCDRCDFGELCRRSLAFGEEDSPFGLDSETRDD